MAGDLAERVAEILTRYSMAPTGSKIGVAVSGGADSVVLLHVLHRLGHAVCVLHVNHQLRGAESDNDEGFVRRLAAELGVDVEVVRAPVSAGNIEQEAREGRRKFFLEAMAGLGLPRIALGHNRGDQAETVLYRLLRGSGIAGLAGMRPITEEGFIRPLLTFGRDEIRHWARAQGIQWREDASNSNLGFVRNRLRQQTVPQLAEEFNPKLEMLLANQAQVAQAEEDWWNARIEGIYRKIARRHSLGLVFSVGALNNLHPAEQRRFLRRTIREVKGDLRSIDLAHVEAVGKIAQSEAAHDRVLLPGVDVLRSFETVLMAQPGAIGNAPRHYDVRVCLGQEVALPFSSGTIYVNWVKTDWPICANFGKVDHSNLEVCELDGDVLFPAAADRELSVRNWEPGDKMERKAGAKAEKLKSLFQDFRVLLWERRSWPVLVREEEVIWSRGFGAAARFRATDESLNIVRLIYRVAG